MSAPTHQLISPVSIVESKTNPRKHFDPAYLERLADSVKKVGVLQPILVRPQGDGYELVCGHCRLRAAKLAGLKAIPATVRELTDLEALEVQLVENLHRADLHPLEEASGYRALMAKPHRYTAAMIAERTGRSIKYIYDRVKLLDLTKEAQRLFLADKITAGHAILLARLSAKDQERAIDPRVNRGYGSHGVWQGEHALFDGDEDERDKYSGLKPVSVRELEAWIDRAVRFDRKNIEPVLFPETAAAIEKAPKVVPITYDHGLSPDLKGDERTICVQSWKRADGKDGSKTCEHSVLGVVVVGRDRGKAFEVCIAKEKCKIHWSKEMAARKRNAKSREKAEASGKPAPALKKSKWEIEQEKRAAAERRYKPAIEPFLAAAAEHIRMLPANAEGVLAKIVREAFVEEVLYGRPVNPSFSERSTADDFVRWLALEVVRSSAGHESGCELAVDLAEQLDIDLEEIIVAASAPKVRACRKCGCTDDNCQQCIEKTGEPCTWVEPDLCSACVPAKKPKRKAS